jgi:replicative DNA helicase
MVMAKRTAEDFKARGNPLALVVIDHMLKIRPSRRYAGQPVKELDEISEAMCVMAKSLNVAVLGLHQLNRGTESRDNPRPVMSDLRGSGSLEQDADVVLFPYRPAYPIERLMQDDPEKRNEMKATLDAVETLLEIQVAKQRQGPTSTLTFYVDMKSNVVRNNTFQRVRP